MGSALVSYPLRLFEICPVSDGAAAVGICSAEHARKRTTKPIWVAASTVATARFDDGIPRGLAGAVPADGRAPHSDTPAAASLFVWAAGRGATARFDDGIPRGLAGAVPADGRAHHSEAAGAVKGAM